MLTRIRAFDVIARTGRSVCGGVRSELSYLLCTLSSKFRQDQPQRCGFYHAPAIDNLGLDQSTTVRFLPKRKFGMGLSPGGHHLSAGSLPLDRPVYEVEHECLDQ